MLNLAPLPVENLLVDLYLLRFLSVGLRLMQYNFVHFNAVH